MRKVFILVILKLDLSITKMATEVIVKKWGNSMGIVLPKSLVEEKKLKENQKVIIQVIKKIDITDLFGSLNLKESAQKLKDRGRKGWN